MNNNLLKIAKVIKKSKNIAIMTHINPDYDALGSSLSLYYGLKQIGKQTHIFINDELCENQKLLIDDRVFEKKCNTSIFDLFISTDTPSKKRLGVYDDNFANAKTSIVLDHHKNDGLIGSYNYVDASSSSCSEICYKLLKALKIKITDNIASLLYIGLTADTNSFINTNTNLNSLYVAYNLIKLGADITKINQVQYRMNTKKEIELKRYLYNNYVLENNIAYLTLSYSQLKKLNARKSDCDFYSTELISIKDANISFSIIESSPNFCEISFRAKSGFNVREIAEQLGGGGHIGAAGAKIEGKSIESVKQSILNIIKSFEIKHES